MLVKFNLTVFIPTLLNCKWTFLCWKWVTDPVPLCTPTNLSQRTSSYNFRMSCRISLERKGRRHAAHLTRSIVLFIKSTPLTLFLHPTGRNFPTNKPIKLSSHLFDDTNVVTRWIEVLKYIAERLCREQIIICTLWRSVNNSKSLRIRVEVAIVEFRQKHCV